jgi:hypothetical protein
MQMNLVRGSITLALVCVLGACSAPAGLSGASAAASGDPLPTKIGRDEAIALVRARSDQVGRVDRAEAKLLTWKEYADLAGPPGAIAADPKASPHKIGTLGLGGDPEMRIIWVVAVSGEVWPQMRVPVWFGGPPPASYTPNPPYRWGLFVIDAARGGLLATVDAGADEPWPPVFAKLPDHPSALGASAPVDPCVSARHLPDIANPSRFAARTLTDVMANLPQDLAWMRLVQDVAGVRSNPMQDPRVPRCRVDLVQIGGPYFARAYPGTTGTWFVPLVLGNDVLLTAFVAVDASGVGMLSGNRGGAIPVPTEAQARAAATLLNDPVSSAELILAIPPGCGASPTPVWRLMRSSGTAVYFALDVYRAMPPGVLFEEKDMRFSSGTGPRAASLARAC